MFGGATFFFPCGFTQALQVYALTTGSFFGSAAILAGFAIGTAPALLALGWASSSLKGKFGKLFFQFSGALVIVLGLWNMQNGLTLAGYPISLPQFKLESAVSAETDTKQDTDKTDPNVKLEGETHQATLSQLKPVCRYAWKLSAKAMVAVPRCKFPN